MSFKRPTGKTSCTQISSNYKETVENPTNYKNVGSNTSPVCCAVCGCKEYAKLEMHDFSELHTPYEWQSLPMPDSARKCHFPPDPSMFSRSVAHPFCSHTVVHMPSHLFCSHSSMGVRMVPSSTHIPNFKSKHPDFKAPETPGYNSEPSLCQTPKKPKTKPGVGKASKSKVENLKRKEEAKVVINRTEPPSGPPTYTPPPELPNYAIPVQPPVWGSYCRVVPCAYPPFILPCNQTLIPCYVPVASAFEQPKEPGAEETLTSAATSYTTCTYEEKHANEKKEDEELEKLAKELIMNQKQSGYGDEEEDEEEEEEEEDEDEEINIENITNDLEFLKPTMSQTDNSYTAKKETWQGLKEPSSEKEIENDDWDPSDINTQDCCVRPLENDVLWYHEKPQMKENWHPEQSRGIKCSEEREAKESPKHHHSDDHYAKDEVNNLIYNKDECEEYSRSQSVTTLIEDNPYTESEREWRESHSDDSTKTIQAESTTDYTSTMEEQNYANKCENQPIMEEPTWRDNKQANRSWGSATPSNTPSDGESYKLSKECEPVKENSCWKERLQKSAGFPRNVTKDTSKEKRAQDLIKEIVYQIVDQTDDGQRTPEGAEYRGLMESLKILKEKYPGRSNSDDHRTSQHKPSEGSDPASKNLVDSSEKTNASNAPISGETTAATCEKLGANSAPCPGLNEDEEQLRLSLEELGQILETYDRKSREVERTSVKSTDDENEDYTLERNEEEDIENGNDDGDYCEEEEEDEEEEEEDDDDDEEEEEEHDVRHDVLHDEEDDEEEDDDYEDEKPPSESHPIGEGGAGDRVPTFQEQMTDEQDEYAYENLKEKQDEEKQMNERKEVQEKAKKNVSFEDKTGNGMYKSYQRWKSLHDQYMEKVRDGANRDEDPRSRGGVESLKRLPNEISLIPSRVIKKEDVERQRNYQVLSARRKEEGKKIAKKIDDTKKRWIP